MKEPKTNKGKFNALITRAERINEQLRKLQEKAQELANDCAIYGDEVDYDDYIYQLRELELRSDDLANFDFEDAIPEKRQY